MLKKLISSINDCEIDKSLINDISIIVADNDINESAKEITTNLNNESKSKFQIKYYSHLEKGISTIRNRLLKEAFFFNPDFLIFIDDDEYVTSKWLTELVKTIINNKCDAARGPVLAEMDSSVPKSISYWFRREHYPDNTQLYSLKTGNLILRCSSLQKFDLWFDPRFNVTGSGDNYFGIQFIKKKGKIFWAANAVTYENIPSKRATLKWLIRRVYRYASTYTYVLKLEKKYIDILKKIFVSILYIIGGVLSLPLLLVPVKIKYWGILKLAEGVGGLTGAFNWLYKEYK